MMAKYFCVANQKGGVAKTTLADHLAWAAKGNVLLVDFDKQGSLSRSFPPTALADPRYLRASRLFDAAPIAAPRIEAISDHLSIIRADDGLLAVDRAENEVIRTPRNALREIGEAFDFVIIDTPPLVGIRLMAALAASDYVVTPLSIGLFELAGFGDLLQTIEVIHKGFNPGLRHIGIQIVKNNDRSAEENDVIKDLRAQYGDLILPYELPQRQTVMQAIAQNTPVWDLSAAKRRPPSKEGEPTKLSIADTWLAACDSIFRRMK